jgi:membrane-bound ClpP family serine protease
MGPAVIITIGVLFLLHEMRNGYFDFSNTYPFILIVIGAVLLASSLAPMTGHIEPSMASSANPPAQPPITPGAPQNPLPGQGR